MPTGGRSEPIARLGPTRSRGLVGKSRWFQLRSWSSPSTVAAAHAPGAWSREDHHGFVFGHRADLQDRLDVPLAIETREHKALAGVDLFLSEFGERNQEPRDLVSRDQSDGSRDTSTGVASLGHGVTTST